MSSKMKKIIALVLAVLMVIPMGTVFSGCSNKEKTFTVTFDAGSKKEIARLADGLDESILVQTVTDASQLIEPVFVCEGAYHHGWNKVLRDIKKDTTVSAMWYDSSFTVKLNPNAQDVELCSDPTCIYCRTEQVVTGILNIKLPKDHWVRKGYTIDWSGFEQIEVPTGKNPSVTIDAKWIPNTYKISFVDSDGVTSILEDAEFKYDLAMQALPTPTMAGKTFIAWQIKGSSTNIYPQASYKFTNDITLQAVWANDNEHSVNITGADSIDGVITFSRDSGKLYLNEPKKYGYKFAGWMGDGVEKDDIGYYIPAGTDNDVNITAQWETKVFNISFDALGGAPEYSQKQVTYGAVIGKLPAATKDGYKFVGWAINGLMDVNSDFVWDIDDSSVRLVAKYLRYYTIEYHLTYTLYEGSKYETVVASKILNEDTALANGFKKSTKDGGVYYKEGILEGSVLESSDFFTYEPLDSDEYYASKNWKARKYDSIKSKYVKYNIKPGMIVNEQLFPGTYESGVIILYASVGAYWTPGYV